ADIDEDAIEKLKLEERQLAQLTKDFINPMTNQSFVNTRLIKVGNKVVKNTSDSQAFKRAFEAMMKRDNQFLGYFEGRSLFGKTKTTR
ncbi:ParA family protein, partial [Lactobacillus mulieris]|nr:ParA family protein [Lactobacillus mulieris]